jgi:hypothetical protein
VRGLVQLIIGWRIWVLFSLHAKRIAVVGGGFLLVTYINNELEQLLILSENTDGQIFLIIAKNLAYLGLVATFFTWPFFSSSAHQQADIVEGEVRSDDSVLKTQNEAFQFIRRQGGIRKKAEILDDLIKIENHTKK